MKYPSATRADHQKFCVVEQWTQRKTSTGRKGTHHVSYEFTLPDGRILWARISHPPGRQTYGASLCSHILRDQFDVTVPVFWACVNDGARPDRGGTPVAAASAIPLGVIMQLVRTYGVPEDEARGMTKAEAIARLTALYSKEA